MVTFSPTSFHQPFSSASNKGTEPSSAGCELMRTSFSSCAIAAGMAHATSVAANKLRNIVFMGFLQRSVITRSMLLTQQAPDMGAQMDE
jgi:hypothetical protein